MIIHTCLGVSLQEPQVGERPRASVVKIYMPYTPIRIQTTDDGTLQTILVTRETTYLL